MIRTLAVLLAILAPCTLLSQVPALTGTILVVNKAPSTLSAVDVASGRVLAVLPTGQGPHEVVLSSDGRLAVVTDYAGQPGKTLTVVSVPDLRVLRTVDLGSYNRPHGISFLPGDSLVAVTSEATANVVLVNVVEGAVRRTVRTTQNGSHMVAVAADGNVAFTGNIGSNTVSELRLRTGEFVRSFAVPDQPEAINVTPDGREVWVGSNATGKISVVQPSSGEVNTVAEGFSWPYRVWFTPNVATVLIPDLRNEVLRFFDRATRRELGRLAFPGGAPQGITTTPDGRYALLSLNAQARVAVIDIATRTWVGYVPAGETPDGVVYTTRVF